MGKNFDYIPGFKVTLNSTAQSNTHHTHKYTKKFWLLDTKSIRPVWKVIIILLQCQTYNQSISLLDPFSLFKHFPIISRYFYTLFLHRTIWYPHKHTHVNHLSCPTFTRYGSITVYRPSCHILMDGLQLYMMWYKK